MSETLPPIQERRPDNLQAVIHEKFLRISTVLPGDYSYHGTAPHYEPPHARSYSTLSSSRVLQTLRRETSNPLRVLDVGAGAGGFITGPQWTPEDTVHGISAYDYRNNPNFYTAAVHNNDNYKIGDAENMRTIPGLLPEYDLITARYVLQHLIDPVGAFEQMADRIAPGGILACDELWWHHSQNDPAASAEVILDALSEAGFDINSKRQRFSGANLQFLTPRGKDISLVLHRSEVKAPVRIPFEPHLARYIEEPTASYTLAS